ncbi:MAG TPA: Pvc16 family protein [Solimonas sp.]|nr:Pvc16 family protein [Solimonas sp.]
MAGIGALQGLCAGLMSTLDRAHQLSTSVAGISCAFRVTGTSELRKLDGAVSTCSLFIYRVTHNEHVRNRQTPARPLTLDAHLMFTIWADSPVAEHSLHAWLARELHDRPMLGRGVLGSSYADDEQVQLVPAELSWDDLTKVWQALNLPYRLSTTYIARNIRIDADAAAVDAAPVVARRFIYQDEVEPA